MSDILLDPVTNDLVFENGDLVLTTNRDPLLQQLKVSLNIYKGEWFVDTLTGVPYTTDFIADKNNKDFIDTYLKNYIRGIDGVVDILAFTSTFSDVDRELEVTFSVLTVEGRELEVTI